MVAPAAQTTMARLILVVMIALAGTVRAVSSSLVHSCGGVGVIDVKEPSVEESCSQ
jgi:hypothetical protein